MLNQILQQITSNQQQATVVETTEPTRLESLNSKIVSTTEELNRYKAALSSDEATLQELLAKFKAENADLYDSIETKKAEIEALSKTISVDFLEYSELLGPNAKPKLTVGKTSIGLKVTSRAVYNPSEAFWMLATLEQVEDSEVTTDQLLYGKPGTFQRVDLTRFFSCVNVTNKHFEKVYTKTFCESLNKAADPDNNIPEVNVISYNYTKTVEIKD